RPSCHVLSSHPPKGPSRPGGDGHSVGNVSPLQRTAPEENRQGLYTSGRGHREEGHGGHLDAGQHPHRPHELHVPFPHCAQQMKYSSPSSILRRLMRCLLNQVPLDEPRSSTKYSGPSFTITACSRETLPLLMMKSQCLPRPMRKRSLSTLSSSPSSAIR